MILVIDAKEDSRFDLSQGRWWTYCNDHDSAIVHDTKADAVAFSWSPQDVCKRCAEMSGGDLELQFLQELFNFCVSNTLSRTKPSKEMLMHLERICNLKYGQGFYETYRDQSNG